MRFLNGCIYKAMLFYKMENELNQLEKELLCQSPKEILKSAYELTFKRELLLLFGESSTDCFTVWSIPCRRYIWRGLKRIRLSLKCCVLS